MQNRRGFTIIELIVVIAIIAVLAAIVTTNVMQYIAKAKDAVIKVEARQLYEEASIFYIKNNSYDNICTNDPEFKKITDSIIGLIPGSNPEQFICNDSSSPTCDGKWYVVFEYPAGEPPLDQWLCFDSDGKSGSSYDDFNCSCSHYW